MKKRLTNNDYREAAELLGVEIEVVKAVAEVEAPMGGFFQDGSVTILFERHKFHQFTGGVYSQRHPDISNPRAGGYIGGMREHLRLKKAVYLDREAALKSTSWGKFQIMGFNYKLCGFNTLQSFINAMFKSEKEQLLAFVRFIKYVGLNDELQQKDWKAFARGYNGKYYYKNGYHLKLQRAYVSHKMGV